MVLGFSCKHCIILVSVPLQASNGHSSLVDADGALITRLLGPEEVVECKAGQHIANESACEGIEPAPQHRVAPSSHNSSAYYQKCSGAGSRLAASTNCKASH